MDTLYWSALRILSKIPVKIDRLFEDKKQEKLKIQQGKFNETNLTKFNEENLVKKTTTI